MKMTATRQPLPSIDPVTPAWDIIKTSIAFVGDNVKLACSFSIEDVVLTDILHNLFPQIGIFAIDTGRLPEETYETAESISQRYGIKIDWYFPRHETVENLEKEKGLFSFRESVENRKECCAIRKVEPLHRALASLDGWLTGMRRDQSVTRNDLQPLETDEIHGGIVKINPLVYWDEKKVWEYAEKHRLPINRLHRLGYPSIGCAPCTRAIKEGEDVRAGRWWWEDPNHKECGLHRR